MVYAALAAPWPPGPDRWNSTTRAWFCAAPNPAPNSTLVDESFTVPGLVTEPGHPLAERGDVGPADLVDQPLITQEEGCPQRVAFERELRASCRTWRPSSSA